MSEYRCYTGKIGDLNKGKEEFVHAVLSSLSAVSEFIFQQKDKWSDQQFLYHCCRELSPNIPSKILQNFISLYNPKRLKKHPKQPIKAGIYIDQNFDLKVTENVMTSYWLRFSKINLPIKASHFKDKVKPEDVKMVHIYKEKGSYYARFTCTKNIDPKKIERKWAKPTSITNQIKNNTTSAGKALIDYIKALPGGDVKKKKFYNNFTNNFLHEATSEIVKGFRIKAVEVLLLENRESLIKASFNKMTTIKGKQFRKLLSGFPYKKFSDLLKYKCLEAGIEVYPNKEAFLESKRTLANLEKSTKRRNKILNLIDNPVLVQFPEDNSIILDQTQLQGLIGTPKSIIGREKLKKDSTEIRVQAKEYMTDLSARETMRELPNDAKEKYPIRNEMIPIFKNLSSGKGSSITQLSEKDLFLILKEKFSFFESFNLDEDNVYHRFMKMQCSKVADSEFILAYYFYIGALFNMRDLTERLTTRYSEMWASKLDDEDPKDILWLDNHLEEVFDYMKLNLPSELPNTRAKLAEILANYSLRKFLKAISQVSPYVSYVEEDKKEDKFGRVYLEKHYIPLNILRVTVNPLVVDYITEQFDENPVYLELVSRARNGLINVPTPYKAFC